jgi:hypothetical protein
MRALVLLAALVCAPMPAFADFLYTYTGTPLTPIGVPIDPALDGAQVSFSFESPKPLPPNLSFDITKVFNLPIYNVLISDWSISVGPYSANLATTSGLGLGLLGLLFDTNSEGEITGWFFDVNANEFNAASQSTLVYGYADSVVSYLPGALSQSTKFGTWSVAEPGSAFLLAFGMLGLIVIRRGLITRR